MITNNDLKYLKLAEVMAEYSDYKRIHIGSCIVKKHSVISTGCNKDKTHPIQLKYNKSLSFKKKRDNIHAEIDALIKAQFDTENATMYVARRGRDNLYHMSKPCPACMEVIKESGIKRIVYTIDNGICELFLK